MERDRGTRRVVRSLALAFVFVLSFAPALCVDSDRCGRKVTDPPAS
jgi:hypothetical protein